METPPSPESKAAAIDARIPVIDPAPAEASRNGSAGSVIAILLIVVLLVIGAFYVWGQRLSERSEQVPAVGT